MILTQIHIKGKPDAIHCTVICLQLLLCFDEEDDLENYPEALLS